MFSCLIKTRIDKERETFKFLHPSTLVWGGCIYVPLSAQKEKRKKHSSCSIKSARGVSKTRKFYSDAASIISSRRSLVFAPIVTTSTSLSDASRRRLLTVSTMRLYP